MDHLTVDCAPSGSSLNPFTLMSSTMSRRHSYPFKVQDVAAQEPLIPWTPPSSANSHHSWPSVSRVLSLGVNWSLGAEARKANPIGHSPPLCSVQQISYPVEKQYIELEMEDSANCLPLELGNFKVQRRVRVWERLASVVVVIALVSVLVSGRRGWTSPSEWKEGVRSPVKKSLRASVPLHSFRANLIEGQGYVTSFPYGGLTNQLNELFKLIHLAHRLDRVAIIPDLTAVHSEGTEVPFATFFDVDAMLRATNVSIVEWRNVKIPDIAGTKPEVLSCWGWRESSELPPLKRYNVETHFWPPPGPLTVPSSLETSMTFPAIEVLVSQPRTEWLSGVAERTYGSAAATPPYPDEQLLCFENLFYIPSVQFVRGAVDTTYKIEELAPSDPVWDTVGRHLHFNARTDALADEVLANLLGSPDVPFVAVHIRQGDFVDLGRASNATAPYIAGVHVVQEEIVKRRGVPWWAYRIASNKPLPVLFATDSTEAAFIRSYTELGWIFIDHKELRTVKEFGAWYPGVLDSLILSRSEGFVGTKQSTFSYVAARRVEAWNGGVTRIVG